jgi:CheY-like chemotaxis protein
MAQNNSKGKTTVLVIEDDNSYLLMLERKLKKAGYQVITGANGMEGIELVESEDFDLLVTDLNMPFVSGIGVISALKEKYPNIPAIAISGYGEKPLEVAKEKKADITLNKPFSISAFVGCIEELIQVSPRQR